MALFKIYFYCAFAYAFSLFARLYWVYWAKTQPNFIFNNNLMINTNDGYAFAEGARDIIASFHQDGDLSFISSSLAKLAAFLVSFGFKLDFIMLYLSTFLSSLVVIAIILIFAQYKAPFLGLIAALIASVAKSYYNRTMSGYFDTDMLVIVLPCFLLYFLISFIKSKQVLKAYLASLSVLFYLWWYPSSFSLNCAFAFFFFLYILLYHRKEGLFYLSLALVLIALFPSNVYLKFIIISLLAYFHKRLDLKIIIIILVLSLAFLIYKNAFEAIFSQLSFYFFKNSYKTSFFYLDVSSTIQEAAGISALEFMQRISSAWWVFAPSLIGLIFLIKDNKSFLLSLPLLFLGFLSFKAGLRFSIYAVPVMAMGFAYFTKLCFLSFSPLQSKIAQSCLCFIALLPSITHIYNYKIPTVFSKAEATLLSDFVASNEAYFIAWWDYGYPLRYFADVKTLVDGGKHLGKDNFFPSYIFKERGIYTHNMAKLAMNYTAKYKANEDLLLKMMQDMGYNNPNDFLKALKDMNIASEQTGYLYLPYRMLDLIPVVYAFSNIDLENKKELKNLFYFKADLVEKGDNFLVLDNGVLLVDDLKAMRIADKQINFKYFINLTDIKNALYKKFELDLKANLYLIYVEQSGAFLVMDEDIYNSSFIQLFLFNNYDKELFKPALSKNIAKIYKVL